VCGEGRIRTAPPCAPLTSRAMPPPPRRKLLLERSSRRSPNINLNVAVFLVILACSHRALPTADAANATNLTLPSPPPSPPPAPPPTPQFARGHCLYVACACDGLGAWIGDERDQCGCKCEVGNDVEAPVVGRTHGREEKGGGGKGGLRRHHVRVRTVTTCNQTYE
jgi:hypothetical protein